MRILFVTAPIAAHTLPTIPLAWALRAAGHEVRYASAGDGAVAVKAGLPLVDVAPGLDIRPMFQPLFDRHGDTEQPRLPTVAETGTIGEIFGAINDALIDGLLAAAAEWHPDLVVHDSTVPVGALLARHRGIPAVEHDTFIPSSYGLREQIAGYIGRAGLLGGSEVPAANPVINLAPYSVVAAHRPGRLVRYLPYSGGGIVPGWLTRTGRPRVVVTAGLTWGAIDPLEQLVKAAGELDAEFVLALSPELLDGLGPLPDNVRAPGWVALSDLLPTADAVVHHGGMGCSLTALAHGVGQLIIPGNISSFPAAAELRARGVARIGFDGDDWAAELTATLTDPALRIATDEVRAELTAAASPAELVPWLLAQPRP